MGKQARIARLEKAATARAEAQRAALEALDTQELECIVRGTAADIRAGRLAGADLAEYCRITRMDQEPGGLVAWLESIEAAPQPGDGPKLKAIMAKLGF